MPDFFVNHEFTQIT